MQGRASLHARPRCADRRPGMRGFGADFGLWELGLGGAPPQLDKYRPQSALGSQNASPQRAATFGIPASGEWSHPERGTTKRQGTPRPLFSFPSFLCPLQSSKSHPQVAFFLHVPNPKSFLHPRTSPRRRRRPFPRGLLALISDATLTPIISWLLLQYYSTGHRAGSWENTQPPAPPPSFPSPSPPPLPPPPPPPPPPQPITTTTTIETRPISTATAAPHRKPQPPSASPFTLPRTAQPSAIRSTTPYTPRRWDPPHHNGHLFWLSWAPSAAGVPREYGPAGPSCAWRTGRPA